VCVEVWRYERVEGIRRVEHGRAQGLGSLRTSSLTPQLPLSPPIYVYIIGHKTRNCATSVLLILVLFKGS
jgi:hypothetical protein